MRDRSQWGHVSSERRRYSIPGVACPKCGNWGTTGVQIPGVFEEDVRTFFKKLSLKHPEWLYPKYVLKYMPYGNKTPMELFNFPLDEVKRIIMESQSLVEGFNVKLVPGAKFCPLTATAAGNIGDFAWANPWTPFLRESVFMDMTIQPGLIVTAIGANVKFKKNPHESLWEIQALPKVHLHPSLCPPACEFCGRVDISVPKRIILDKSTFDPKIAIQRIVELPTVLIINQHFADYIREEKLTDVLVAPIEML